MILSVPSLIFLAELRQQLDTNDDYRHKRQAIMDFPAEHPEYSVTQNLVLNKVRIWLCQNLLIITTLLIEYHATPTGGHAWPAYQRISTGLVSARMLSVLWPNA